MKLKNPLLVVSDLEASKRFYREVLGLRVILDFWRKRHPDRRALPANPRKAGRDFSQRLRKTSALAAMTQSFTLKKKISKAF